MHFDSAFALNPSFTWYLTGSHSAPPLPIEQNPTDSPFPFGNAFLDSTPPNQECEERIRGVAADLAAADGAQRWRRIGAYLVGTQYSARGACEVSPDFC